VGQTPAMMDCVVGDSYRDTYRHEHEHELSADNLLTSASGWAGDDIANHMGQRRHKDTMNSEEMKAKVRLALETKVYNVFDFYHTEGLWQKIARSSLFENITLGVITLNALWIAVDTDHNTATSLLTADYIFQLVDHGFCFYFSLEWFVRFQAFKRKRDGFRDAWFVFDSCLVFMMVGETWIMTTFTLLLGGGGSSVGGDASILRLFRLARLSRLARMLRSMPELMILIKGMMSSTGSVCSVMSLLVASLYIFAIVFTQLAAGTDMGKKYFPNVGKSMYTLLIHGAFTDDLSTLSTAIQKESVPCLWFLFVFILLANLTVMNMLIGVLCEVVSLVSATEKEDMMVNFVTGKLQQILMSLDADNDMLISKDEFAQILTTPEAVKSLQEVGVDVAGIVDFTDFIFDEEGSPADQGDAVQTLCFEDFMEVVLTFRGSNEATVRDIVELRKFICGLLDNVEDRLNNPNAKRICLRSKDKDQPGQPAAPPTQRKRERPLPEDAAPLLEPAPEPPVQSWKSCSFDRETSLAVSEDSIVSTGPSCDDKGQAPPGDVAEVYSPKGGARLRWAAAAAANLVTVNGGDVDPVKPSLGAARTLQRSRSSALALRQLQQRVACIETTLVTLLTEVRSLAKRLPLAQQSAKSDVGHCNGGSGGSDDLVQ